MKGCFEPWNSDHHPVLKYQTPVIQWHCITEAGHHLINNHCEVLRMYKCKGSFAKLFCHSALQTKPAFFVIVMQAYFQLIIVAVQRVEPKPIARWRPLQITQVCFFILNPLKNWIYNSRNQGYTNPRRLNFQRNYCSFFFVTYKNVYQFTHMGQEAYLSTELWTLSIELGSGRPSGAWNLEVAHRFL
jgi:hypothetical protein